MEEETLSESDRRALRGSKFAPLPAPPPSSRSQPRLAHPGGPMTTNKAAALAKFLERKLQQPGGLNSINPDLLEVAVKNAKGAVSANNGGASSSGRMIRHVASFDDSCEESREDQDRAKATKPKRKKKKGKKSKKLLQKVQDPMCVKVKKTKKSKL